MIKALMAMVSVGIVAFVAGLLIYLSSDGFMQGTTLVFFSVGMLFGAFLLTASVIGGIYYDKKRKELSDQSRKVSAEEKKEPAIERNMDVNAKLHQEESILQYCPHCGRQTPVNNVFCPYCGNRLKP